MGSTGSAGSRLRANRYLFYGRTNKGLNAMDSNGTADKVALVCGAGGFIGHHLVQATQAGRLLGARRRLEISAFSETEADDFVIGDLQDPHFVRHVIDRRFDEIYQLAADMGGAGYIFTGEHDADVMHNSASINLNILQTCICAQQQADLLLFVCLHLSGI